MSVVTLNWRDANLSEEEHRVYRAQAPIDVDALPEPLAVLPANTTTYTDTTAADNTTYHYAVSAKLKGVEALSMTVEVTTGTSQVTRLAVSHFDELDAAIHDGVLLSGDAQTGSDIIIL